MEIINSTFVWGQPVTVTACVILHFYYQLARLPSFRCLVLSCFDNTQFCWLIRKTGRVSLQRRWCVHCCRTPETAIGRPLYVDNSIPPAANRICLPTATVTYCKRKIFTDTLLINRWKLRRNSYRVIQEEGSIFSDFMVSVTVRNNSSYERMCNCE